MSFVSNKEEFSFIWVQFQFTFIDIHDWTETKHDCKPFSAAAELPDGKVHIQLVDISVEVVRDSVSRDHATQRSGMDRKVQGT